MRAAAPNRAPALAASLALHAAILLAAIIAWPWLHKPINVGEVVSVNLISSNDLADMRGAIAAPTPQQAATSEPVPQAAPQAPAPVEAPTPLPMPTPPQPKAAPTPAKPLQTKPVPTPSKTAKQTPAKPATPSFDPDAVLASLNQTNRSSGAHQSSARRGASQAQTAVQARLANGSSDAASASALNNIGAAIQKVWRPNCTIAGAADANITVSFILGPGGRLIGTPKSSAENATDPVLAAFSQRAVSAIPHAAPFDGLPASLYNQQIELKFSGQAACAGH
jgi:outer membrane biosynthesis protein TonB